MLMQNGGATLRKFASAVLGTLTLISSTANAQTRPASTASVDEALLSQLDMAPLKSMCSTGGVLQFDFGTSDIPPTLATRPGTEFFELSEKFAPFTEVSISGTKWTNRFFQAEFTMPLRDPKLAPPLIEHIAARVRQWGWHEHRPEGDSRANSFEAELYSEPAPPSGERTKGVQFSVFTWGGALKVQCTDISLLQVQMSEVFTVPSGTPRPVPPKLPPMLDLDRAACATPEGQARINAYSAEGGGSVIRVTSQLDGYAQRIAEWKLARLEQSGKVSKARLLGLMGSGLADGSPNSDPMAGFAALDRMIEAAKRTDQFKSANNALGICQASVDMFIELQKIARITGGQWRGIERKLDAEAARVGVSFD